MKSLLSSLAEGFLTPVSMQTTHSELPGPSTGLGAEGVTGVPGVNGGLGTLEAEALGRYAGDKGAGAVRPTCASSSCSRALHAPGGGGDCQRIAYRLSLNLDKFKFHKQHPLSTKEAGIYIICIMLSKL